MSLWRSLAACGPEIEQRMRSYYDEKGLADIRVYFGQWIEDRIMSERISTTTDDLYEQIAFQFYTDLKQKLISLGDDNLMKFKIAEICSLVTQTTAVDLYSHVRNGLQTEIQLLEQMPQNPNIYSMSGGLGFGGGGGGGNGLGSMAMGGGMMGMGGIVGGGMHGANALYSADARMQNLIGDVSNLYSGTVTLQADYDSLSKCWREYNHNKPMLAPQMQRENEMKLNLQITKLNSCKVALVGEVDRIKPEYEFMANRVINELRNWQRNQALAGNGAPFTDNLDDIQRYIETLVEMVCKILDSVKILMIIKVDDELSEVERERKLGEILRDMRQAQEMLVLTAFIVEKQPPQVMKTNTRFATAVRWLIGPQLGIYQNNIEVHCVILSEAQAFNHSQKRNAGAVLTTLPSSTGEITNCTISMEYQQQTRVFSASFRNMQLRKIKRAEKKGTESVMDEKFALLFYATCTVNNYEIRVWTLSLPVVVIVHGNQEPQSWATITWDNAFSEIARDPFKVPEQVSWSLLSMALNTKFASTTGRGLTDENLNFLYEKLFRNDGMGGDHKDYITWAQFCKEPLPDRSFTFWDWFFAIMKLTKDHLLGLWKANLIIGFINKRRTTDEILRMTDVGTFLLRFSDSELGGITVAFVDDQRKVLMLSPWTARDLNIRGLADRVHDLPVLRYVYPLNKLKDEAFAEFYTQRIDEQASRDGYVANTIRAVVPAIEDGGSLMSTPQHHMQSPNPQEMQMGNYVDDIDMYLNDTAIPKHVISEINWDSM